VFEFFMGCLAAHVFISLTDRPVGRVEQWLAHVALVVILLFLTALGLCFYVFDLGKVVKELLGFLAMNFLCAPAIAGILFYVARYDSSPFTRLMSSSPLVAGGERSYSIYLVHTWTVLIFAQAPARELNWLTGADAVLRIFCAIALTLVVSHATYQLIEVPGRTWLRRKLITRGLARQQIRSSL
jgi:peptidoglycan/LPS O-acetylase OafA/YrhL